MHAQLLLILGATCAHLWSEWRTTPLAFCLHPTLNDRVQAGPITIFLTVMNDACRRELHRCKPSSHSRLVQLHAHELTCHIPWCLRRCRLVPSIKGETGLKIYGHGTAYIGPLAIWIGSSPGSRRPSAQIKT